MTGPPKTYEQYVAWCKKIGFKQVFFMPRSEYEKLVGAITGPRGL